MSYPKQWDSKVMLAVLPYRINNHRLCHNCQYEWLPEDINVCTGLCPNCVENNIAQLGAPSQIVHHGDNVRRCIRCNFTKMQNSNFGIIRDTCRVCLIQSTATVQRCLSCDIYRSDCWKNVCQGCRYNKYLCEKTGQFYANENVHWRRCWCLSYDQRILRNEVMTNNI